jgi:SlyX protein
MADLENRIMDLETLVTHQARSIEELSSMVAEQWQIIDAMRGKLDALTERFMALEEQAIARPEAGKPPHW